MEAKCHEQRGPLETGTNRHCRCALCMCVASLPARGAQYTRGQAVHEQCKKSSCKQRQKARQVSSAPRGRRAPRGKTGGGRGEQAGGGAAPGACRNQQTRTEPRCQNGDGHCSREKGRPWGDGRLPLLSTRARRQQGEPGAWWPNQRRSRRRRRRRPLLPALHIAEGEAHRRRCRIEKKGGGLVRPACSSATEGSHHQP